jgi:hypothetical protein
MTITGPESPNGLLLAHIILGPWCFFSYLDESFPTLSRTWTAISFRFPILTRHPFSGHVFNSESTTGQLFM